MKNNRSTSTTTTTPYAALTVTTRESSILATATATATSTNEHDEKYDNENTIDKNTSVNMNMNISTNANTGADDSFFQYPTDADTDTDTDDHDIAVAAFAALHDENNDNEEPKEEDYEQYDEPPPPQEEPNEDEMEEALHSSMAVQTGHHLDDLPPRTLPRNTNSTTTPAKLVPTPTPMKTKTNAQLQHNYNSKEEEVQDLEAMGLITPRKDLQSPPFVKRRMAMAMESEVSSPPFRNFERGVPYRLNHEDDGHNDDGGGDNRHDDDDETSSLVSEYGSEVGQAKFRMEDIQAMEALTEGECEGDGDGDGDGEGEGEGEGEEESDDHDNMEGQDSSSTSKPAGAGMPVETNDSGVSYESLKDFSERVRVNGSDCDSDVAISTTTSTPSNENGNGNGNFNNDRTRNDHNRRDRDNEDELSQEDDGSVDSVDLSSHYGPISPEGIGQGHINIAGTSTGTGTGTKINTRKRESMVTNFHISNSSSTATKTNTTSNTTATVTTTASTHSNAVQYSMRRGVPTSPMATKYQYREDNEPTTPIGAMSAALRRLGNGVSNMARCTKTPPQSSPHHYTSDDAPFSPHNHAQQQQGAKGQGQGQGHDDKKHNVWLSPRYGNSKNHVSKTSIQQPMFRSAPHNRNYRQGTGTGTRANTNVNAHTSNGITSCLSFDPESGRRPYGNMRMTDSPPSSPLPSHRKTRSWGSSGSDFFMGNVKDLFVGGGTGASNVTGGGGIVNSPGYGRTLTGLGARYGQPYHGSSLSPKREGIVSMSQSPKARIRFVEDHLHSPKPAGNNRAIVLLQSPQVSAFDHTLVQILRRWYMFVLLFWHVCMHVN